MKTTRNLIRSSVGLVASGLFAAAALAGPGPQYWQQMEKIRSENAARAAAQSESTRPAAMACPACKTTAITEYRPSPLGGKFQGRFERVGTKHSCDACGGAITTVRGKTTNAMKANCPICAKAGPTCCTT